MKIQMCVTAQTNLGYARPGKEAALNISLYYGDFQGKVGDVKVDDYKNVSKMLHIFELDVDTSQWRACLSMKW